MEQEIEIKNRYTGDIIFKYKTEDNTIKKTLIKAIKSYADLRYADLHSANLHSADLRYADLRYADLHSANLHSADLRYADLSSADLHSANLRSANLHSANLDKRYISITRIGSRKSMTTYCFDDDTVWCGCFKGSLEAFEEKVTETHKNNEQYLKEYIGFINYLKSLK